jgi:hypothetical protein
MSISAALLLFDFAEVKIAKIGILGTDLVVGNVHVLIFSAWVLWAYFFLRYYQYWRMGSRKVRDAFEARFQHYLNIYAGNRRDEITGSFLRFELVRSGLLKWNNVASAYSPVIGEDNKVFARQVSILGFAIMTTQAAGYVALHTTHVTDHLLPFALGIAAPVATLWSMMASA